MTTDVEDSKVVCFSVLCSKSFKYKRNGFGSLETNCGFTSLRVNSSAGGWHKDVDKQLKWEVVHIL